MKNVFKPLLISVVVGTLVNGCSVTPQTEKMKYEPLQKKQITFVPEHTSTYLREVTPEEEGLNKKVNLVGSVTLIDALRLKLPRFSVLPKDQNVNLTKNIDVSANGMFVKDYLAYLSALSGYEISLIDGAIEVSSFVRKEWNVGAFASKRHVLLKVGAVFDSSTGEKDKGRSNTIGTTFNDDEWEIIVSGAEKILGVSKKKSSSKKDKDAGIQPYVQAVRSVGLIQAGGAPQRMQAVDEFVRSITESGSKQVNISVKAFDVLLNDDRGVGIDWSELSFAKQLNGNDFGVNFGSLINGVTNADNTLFKSAVNYGSDEVTANGFLNFLSKFGEVELLNQPNVTVRNGSYAFIATGEELSYVANISTTSITDIEGDNPSLISKSDKTLDQLRVGVTLAVTPRILDDGRVLLDIWPVVTSVDRFDTFTTSGESIDIPHVSLQELSTQVIAESGKPIQLGGFIRRSIAKSLQELPWQDKISNMLFNPIFKSETQGVERRELVLTVTSTIIDGA